MKKPYTPGEHKTQCEICKRTRRNTEVRPQWDGRIVCADRCYSPKHPNDYPRPVVNDGLPVPDARPRPTIEQMTSVAVLGTTQWTDTTLLWTSPDWIWSDDTSQVSLQSLIMHDPSLDL